MMAKREGGRPAETEAASRQVKSHRKKKKEPHLHNKSPADDVIDCSVVELVLGLVVEVFLVGADGLQQLQHVVGIQGAGLGGQAAGQVGVADVCYALVIKKKVDLSVKSV